MKPEKWFRETLESVKDDLEFRLETKILDLTEKICEVMERKKISRKELAKRLKVTPANVTKILRGSSNFTLKSLLSLADVLELDLDIRFTERKKQATTIQLHHIRETVDIDYVQSHFTTLSHSTLATDVSSAYHISRGTGLGGVPAAQMPEVA